jgi:hypothetical protein
MRHSWRTWIRLALACLLGSTALAGCTVADFRKNVIAGALGFVEDYTADLLAELLPAPGELIRPSGDAGA